MSVRRRTALLAGAIGAVLAGAVVLALAVWSQEGPPPRPPASAGSPPASTGPTSTAPTQEAADPLPASRPVSITIPAIDVQSPVFPIGKTPSGELAVPQPGPNLDKAAWYKNSPTPGQLGPAIIEGHVATEQQGPSVFYRLGDLRPGDKIRVRRADGTTVEFTVQKLRRYPKDEFPTRLVYGGRLGTSTLRLITCSNFDPDVGSHTANLIVFSERSQVSGR